MGKLITDAAIQAEQRKANKSGGVSFLTDPAPRGAGRLTIRIAPGKAEWFARRTVAGKRAMTKLGNWPSVSVQQARALFNDEPATGPAPAATLADLIDGYTASLEAAGKSTKQPAKMLAQAAAVIGRDKPAAEVTPADIVAVVKPIYDRGAHVLADKMRMWLRAAFRWGMQAEHDYRVEKRREWGLKSNPVDAVPRDTQADRVGTRWLSHKEFRDMLHWAMASRAPSRRAAALLALTGQRVREITELRASQWDSARRLLYWGKTKNGLPHMIPVCEPAAQILDALRPNEHGLLFANRSDPTRPMPDGSVLVALKKYAAHWKMRPFSGRDLRRTWKTLAGEAGLSKQERDLLQNHTEGGDVSTRHYDRYEYMAEKRAAVAKWEAWLNLEPHTGRHVVVRRVKAAQFQQPAD